MQENSGSNDGVVLSLLEYFTNGLTSWESFKDMRNQSSEFASLFISTLESFKKCETLVNENSLFSTNELIADIPTTSLKYLSISYYLGEVYQKTPLTAPKDRLPHLKFAKTYYEDFLDICRLYSLIDKKFLESYYRKEPVDSSTNRTEKIEMFKYEKSLEERLQKMMHDRINQGLIDDDEGDNDEFERETALLFLQQTALTTISTLKTLKHEIEILDHMATLMQDNNGVLPEIPVPERQPFKPIVLVDPRKQIMDNAFKPGWNLPTVSIEEAGMIDYQDAIRRQQQSNALEEQKLVKEYGDHSSDEETQVYKDREWDEFKDDNPKGSGNTGTKGYRY